MARVSTLCYSAHMAHTIWTPTKIRDRLRSDPAMTKRALQAVLNNQDLVHFLFGEKETLQNICARSGPLSPKQRDAILDHWVPSWMFAVLANAKAGNHAVFELDGSAVADTMSTVEAIKHLVFRVTTPSKTFTWTVGHVSAGPGKSGYLDLHGPLAMGTDPRVFLQTMELNSVDSIKALCHRVATRIEYTVMQATGLSLTVGKQT